MATGLKVFGIFTSPLSETAHFTQPLVTRMTQWPTTSQYHLPAADVADHCSDVGRSVTRRRTAGKWGDYGWDCVMHPLPLSSPHRILDPILFCVRREE